MSRHIIFLDILLLLPINIFLTWCPGGHTATVETQFNNSFLQNFVKRMFSTFEDSFASVDLSQLSNFQDNKCLIAITNFQDSNPLFLEQPVLIRKPILAILKIHDKRPLLSWVLEHKIRLLDEKKLSCLQTSKVPAHQLTSTCERHDLWRLALRSKVWQCELHLDIFPPFTLYIARNLIRQFKGLLHGRFKYPSFWHYRRNYGGHNALVSKVPTFHIFMVPSVSQVPEREIRQSLPNWMYGIISENFPDNINIGFLLAEMQNNRKYSISIIRSVYFEAKSKVSIFATGKLSPPEIYRSFKEIWSRQMWWEILPTDEKTLSHFLSCNNILSGHHQHNPLIALNAAFKSAQDILPQAIVHIWQSILGNHTYLVDENICTNGKLSRFKLSQQNPLSRINPKYETVRRLLHYPLHIPDPLGSYRYVVCGMRGTESIAFQELLTVYDKRIWIIALVFIVILGNIWKYLISHSSHKTTRTQHRSQIQLGYSLIKLLLEQGNPFPAGAYERDRKIQIILGTFMLAGIVLSNGYKNSNVYNMVSPRKPIRYNSFYDLISDNVSVYVTSRGIWGAWPGALDMRAWLGHNISVRVESPQQVSYFEETLNRSILTAIPDLPDNSKFKEITGKANASYWESDKEIHQNMFVRNNSRTQTGNVLIEWIQWFRGRFPGLNEFLESQDLYTWYFKLLASEYTKAEEFFLLRLLSKCNPKIAFVTHPNVAENFARYLTPARGNTGKETYFRRYFVFEMTGLITPPVLNRLAGLKESGLLKWWSNITEYISVSKLQRNLIRDDLFASVKHGTKGSCLQGNVVVIFCLLFGGILVAIFDFLAELLIRAEECVKARPLNKTYIYYLR